LLTRTHKRPTIADRGRAEYGKHKSFRCTSSDARCLRATWGGGTHFGARGRHGSRLGPKYDSRHAPEPQGPVG